MIFVRDCTCDGAKLKKLRSKAGHSLSEVAEAVGLQNRSAVSKIERTGRTTSDVLVRLLKLYGVTDVRRIVIHAPNGTEKVAKTNGHAKRPTQKRRK